MMQRTRCLLLLMITTAVLGTAGCQSRFYDHRTLRLGVGEISTLIIDPVTHARTLQIEGTSDTGAVDVFVYLEENQDEAERMITLNKSSDLVIASVRDAQAFDLAAPLPADKRALVMIRSAADEATNVDLRMSDQ